MKQNKLRIGDEVFWRNSWGKDAPQKVKVKTITINNDSPSLIKEVNEIDWSKVKDRNLIIDFYDNTNWAWAYQIEKLEE